jgi:DNA-binding CsgD family transcriptional regulator
MAIPLHDVHEAIASVYEAAARHADLSPALDAIAALLHASSARLLSAARGLHDDVAWRGDDGNAHASSHRMTIVVHDAEGDGPPTRLAVLRRQDAPAFSESERDALALIAPHVDRALRMRSQLSSAEALHSTACAVLHTIGFGAALIDRARQVVMLNDAARRLCRAQLGLFIADDRFLRARLAASDRALQTLLAQAVGGSEADSKVALDPMIVVRDPQRPGELIVTVVRLPQDATGPSDIARAAVFIERPGPAGAGAGQLYSLLFGLTAAERQVAMALVAGASVREIADGAGISQSTVRSHIKALHQKTRTRSTAAMVAALASVGRMRAAGFDCGTLPFAPALAL